VDRWLFGVTLLLVLIGLVMVFSASAVIAKEKFGSPYYFMMKQTLWAFAGVGAMFLMMKVDYRIFRHPAFVYSSVAITTLLLVLVLFLDRSHNTHRWIKLGAFSFQPSELAKPALIIYLAYFLESRLRDIDDWRRTLLPAVIPTLLFAALIVKQPDLGTAMACCAITGTVLWVAGIHPKYLGYALAGSMIPLYVLIFRTPWRYQRILAFMDPYSDPQGKGFHIVQCFPFNIVKIVSGFIRKDFHRQSRRAGIAQIIYSIPFKHLIIFTVHKLIVF
jgi:cell division protein FtsW